MKTIKNKVKQLLQFNNSLRDNDFRLSSYIWLAELRELNLDPERITALKFLKLYAEEKLTLGSTIKRARAKLQEENSDMRGRKYYIRKGKAEEAWRINLGYER